MIPFPKLKVEKEVKGMWSLRFLAVFLALTLGVQVAPAVGQATEKEQPAAAQPEETPQAAPAEEAKEPAEPEEPDELTLMKQELERLSTEYQLLQQRQKNELVQSELTKQKIAAEAALRQTQQQEQLAGLRAEVERLEAQAALKKAQLQQQLTEMQATIEQRGTARKVEELDRAEELARLQAEAQRLSVDNQIRMEEVKAAQTQVEVVRQQFSLQVAELKGKLEVRQTRDEANSRVLADVEYLRSPVVEGMLYISDRRIPLNGPIIGGTANYVTERIHYFNNQSKELPIFIVIDSCPGGSVREGYRILKGMESSPAPIYVVVKSFAASMAAVITTMADHSYAYPNAIILHHQMSSGMYGNLTQQKEQLDNAMEWARRLAVPVAEKMGVSYERMVQMMYEHNSDGDWEEFADQAVNLNWVGNVIQGIREASFREKPTGDQWDHYSRSSLSTSRPTNTAGPT